MPDITFSPVRSLARLFEATPEHKFLFIMGPVGSTKTTTAIMFMLMSASMQTPSPDGIRRTRFGVIRNTLLSIKQTVLRDILSLFGKIAEYQVTNNIVMIRVADIESEWLLLPLEHAEDQRRLLSLQLTAVYAEEIREIDIDLLFTAFTRTGRYPSEKHGGVPVRHRFLLGVSNMGTRGSRLYQFLEEEEHEEVLYIHQPSAESEEADWLKFLPLNYYQDAKIGATQAWIDTHVHAQWSHDLTGLPIFADLFNPNWHVSSTPLVPIHGMPLIIPIDPGFNPAALICQLTQRGQLRVYREVYAPNCLFGMFIDQYVMPVVTMPGYSLKPLQFIADPSAVNRNAVTGMSAYGVLEDKKLAVELATTNDVDPRLKAVERLLTETRGVETNLPNSPQIPALLIDRSCEVLIRALSGAYRFKKKKLTGELEDKPEKKHPISDVTDCLGYVGLGLGTASFVKSISRFTQVSKSLYKSPPKRGWT